MGGGGEVGHPDPEIRTGGAVPKKNFSALRASVLSKNRAGPSPTNVDPPLYYGPSCEKHIFTPGYDKNAL